MTTEPVAAQTGERARAHTESLVVVCTQRSSALRVRTLRACVRSRGSGARGGGRECARALKRRLRHDTRVPRIQGDRLSVFRKTRSTGVAFSGENG